MPGTRWRCRYRSTAGDLGKHGPWWSVCAVGSRRLSSKTHSSSCRSWSRNAVRHTGVPDGGVVVLRVELTGTMARLEVTDPGSGAVIAPRAPDLERGGGFGLHVVRALSERWGLEQAAAGGTRVWAQLPRVPPAAPASAQSGDVAGDGSRNGDRATGERKPSAGVRVHEQPGRAVR
jgi:hypothetical protein